MSTRPCWSARGVNSGFEIVISWEPWRNTGTRTVFHVTFVNVGLERSIATFIPNLGVSFVREIIWGMYKFKTDCALYFTLERWLRGLLFCSSLWWFSFIVWEVWGCVCYSERKRKLCDHDAVCTLYSMRKRYVVCVMCLWVYVMPLLKLKTKYLPKKCSLIKLHIEYVNPSTSANEIPCWNLVEAIVFVIL